ncbi:MAG: N-formylglutamate deformylase [Alphaproteobacteria bacterium]|nr:N-formylglutamate deformylase [Alphaproteobacteria bacterium]
MTIYRLHEGQGPVLVSIPHAGTEIPEEISARLTPEALQRPDTDWRVDRLYGFAGALGCSVLAADYSRYVVDLNRPPDDAPLYPGQAGTGLVPIDDFRGRPLYVNDMTPDMAETFARVEGYWKPYHAALQAALARIQARFGFAVLWEAHSIRSRVPRLFEGRLPDLNLGTADGASCAPALADAVLQAAEQAIAETGAGYSLVRDGRFKGGYSTRHYGQPAEARHALQLEIAQASYMDEAPPYAYDAAKAETLQAVLRPMLQAAQAWRPI